MKKMTIEDDMNLVSGVNSYFRTGDMAPAVEACCVWLWKASRDRFNMAEDECSDLVEVFLKNPGYPLDYFRKNGFPHFPSFFYSYLRNLICNHRRLKKKEYSEKYLALWDEGEGDKRELLNKLWSRLEEGVSGLSDRDRILLKLRMNLSLEKNDWQKIREYTGHDRAKLDEFIVTYNRKQEKLSKEKEELLVRMNHYNRKILEHGIPKYSDSKKRLLKRLDNLNYVFTYRELGELTSQDPCDVANTCKKAVRRIRESIDEKKAA